MSATVHDKAAIFQSHRGLLFSIAYRMTGSGADAEDLVQDAWFRWERNADAVEHPKAWLVKVVTRLCLDYLKSARVQREMYVGPWLPEPIVASDAANGDVHLADTLSTAFLVLLERLNPTERAVFLLREAFDYDYGDIAAIVDKSEANCRQLVKRAKERLALEKPRFLIDRGAEEQYALKFIDAIASNDMDGLLQLLSDDIVLYSDGGGKALAAINPIFGPDRVARFLFGVLKKKPDSTRLKLIQVNGGPGILLHNGAVPDTITTFAVAEGRITGIYSVRNPDKLGRAAQLLAH